MFKLGRSALKLAMTATFIFFSQNFALFANSQIIFRDSSVLKNEFVDISKRWDYCEGVLVDPENFYPDVIEETEAIVDLPHKLSDGVHLATYHLRLTGLRPNGRYSSDLYGSPVSASRIWCNGKIVASGGFLSKDKKLCTPGEIFTPPVFQADHNGVVDIVIHIANFERCEGGMTKEISITSIQNQKKFSSIDNIINTIILAFLMANIIYNVVLAALNFKQMSYITLAIICAIYSLMICVTGQSIFFTRELTIPFWLHRKAPLLTLSLASALELLYTMNINKYSSKKTVTLFALAFANALAVLFCDPKFFPKAKWFFICIALAFSLISIAIPLKFAIKRNLDAKRSSRKTTAAYNLASALAIVIFICRVSDFLIAPQKLTIIHSYTAFKISFLIFGICQCSLYAFNRNLSISRVSRQMQKFADTNNTLSKIVPSQVLKLLGANDITKIIPGESRIIDAVLLSVEIKHFNKMAESISKQELYSIQTDFFQSVSPIINDSGGFVAKYAISGCLGIFQQRNTDAIICASRIQKKIKEIRRKLRKTKRTDISVGIAIHSGKVAIGTIGSSTRLDTIALSDDVNIVNEVGKHTSKLHAKILITEEAMPFCRSYVNYVYEGHFFISNGKQILVYSALPIKKNDQAFEDTLEPIEEDDEI